MIKTVTINGLEWMSKNLDVEVPDSWYYREELANGKLYGRLYTWESAQAACDLLGEGWRLPTDAEWRALAMAHGGYYDWHRAINEGSPSLGFENLMDLNGFAAKLGGCRFTHGGFGGVNNRSNGWGRWGTYWSSSLLSDMDRAWSFDFDAQARELHRVASDLSLGFSVRCVRG